MELSEWLNAAAILASGLGVYAGIRGIKSQIQTETFIRYSDKMIEVIDKYQPDDLMAYKDKPFTEYPDQDALEEYMFRYYDVVFHEFQLKQLGSVNPKIWGTWKRGVRRYLSFRIYAEGWREIREVFAIHPKFVKWMDAEYRKYGWK